VETTDLSYYSLWESGAMEMGGSIKLFSMGWYFACFGGGGRSMGINFGISTVVTRESC
jgi:hypothetical protein